MGLAARRRSKPLTTLPGVLRRTAIVLAGVCSLALCACGDTLQNRPIPHNELEGMILAPYPVYWLGASFHGMALTEAVRDPGGAYSVQYGNCLSGGQGVCIPPLRVVTSPDNGFLPGGDTPAVGATIRGVGARVAEGGRAITIPTGGVVVDVYAKDPAGAAAAAATLVPINAPGSPGSTLPAALPDTGFGSTPLPSQTPNPVRPAG